MSQKDSLPNHADGPRDGLAGLKAQGRLYEPVPEPADSGIFDLRDLNLALKRAKCRDNLVSAGAAVFCLVIVALLLAFDLGRAWRGLLPTFGVVILFVAVVWLLGITGALLRGIWRKRPGGEALMVNDQGLTLEVPDGPTVHVLWSDPRLQIELHDLSRVNPGVLSVSTPYFLKVEGVHSAISKQAYEAILDQVRSHGLVDRTGHASRWFSPSGAMRHVVSGRPAS